MKLEKLLHSAISNWELKSGEKIDEGVVYVKSIAVDSARMLKRLRSAPQGRGHRIRKRSNHVTIILDTISNRNSKNVKAEVEEEETNTEA